MSVSLLCPGGPVRAPSVSLLAPSPQQRSGSRLSLLCLLSAYSPQGAEVSWEVDGQMLTDTGGYRVNRNEKNITQVGDGFHQITDDSNVCQQNNMKSL